MSCILYLAVMWNYARVFSVFTINRRNSIFERRYNLINYGIVHVKWIKRERELHEGATVGKYREWPFLELSSFRIWKDSAWVNPLELKFRLKTQHFVLLTLRCIKNHQMYKIKFTWKRKKKSKLLSRVKIWCL